jgi:CheY-like chemotaxis protein
LSVVKRLVEMQSGTVSARSDGLGKGSTFEIRLPVALGVDATEHADKQRAEATSLRVLVVDDNTDAADSMAMALQTTKHDVRTVYGASQALQLAREWRPHAILLDIGLPELDGYSVARRLREDPAMDGTHLIALTGYGQPVDKARALEAGFSRHLVKPAPLADVLEALEVIGASF